MTFLFLMTVVGDSLISSALNPAICLDSFLD